MTLEEREQALLNQLNQMKVQKAEMLNKIEAQKAEDEKAVTDIDNGIKRLEGALILIGTMKRDTEKAPEIASE